MLSLLGSCLILSSNGEATRVKKDALAISGNWNWKVYGPDLSGTYGGLQGLGGLEAVIGSDGTTRGIVNDWWGNAVGHVAAPGGAMVWSSAQFLAWGPAPGWGTEVLDGTRPLHELLGYRGLTVDPPGYVHQGFRDYDPQVGRWLSPDPLGHAGSLSLYDYCDNDPLNVFDPDGRFGKQALSGSAVYLDAFNNTFYGTIGGAAKAADWVSETFVGTPNLGAGIANWADSNMDLGLKMGWYQETDASIAIKTGFGIAAAMIAPESRIASAKGIGAADDVVDLYRFVSPAEFDDIAKTGQFRFAPGQMEAKQFGFEMNEVLNLSDYFPDAAAIMKAQVPRSTLQHFDLTPVDAHILRSGSATVLGQEQLRLLNQSLLGPIIHAF